MNKRYFVITRTDNGDFYVEHLTKEQLLSRIHPDSHGDRYYGGSMTPRFVTKIEDLLDHTDVFVIEGKVVAPNRVEVVTKFELPE